MKKARLAICAGESAYVERLHGYLKEHLGFPVEIADYLDASYLDAIESREEIAVLLIQEEEADKADLSGFPAVVILTEDEGGAEVYGETQTVVTRSRYLRASEIAGTVMELLSRDEEIVNGAGACTERARIIGYYSPLGRCMQTSMAIAAGQLACEGMRPLYIGFAPFAPEDLCSRDGDLADLLYYHNCDREHFTSWFTKIKKQTGGLPYIPTAASTLLTEGSSAAEWTALIETICSMKTTDLVLLDLSGSVPGLAELLRLCDRIYTITGADSHDHAKIAAYKRWLVLNEEEDILKKTVFCALPSPCPLPAKKHALKNSTLAQHLWAQGLVPGRE